MMRSWIAGLTGLALFAGCLSPVVAQDQQASRDRELLRRATAALREAEDRNATMAAENAKLQAEIQKLKRSAAKIEDSLSAERKRLSRAAGDLGETKADLDRVKGEKDALQAKLDATEAELQRTSDELARTTGALDAAKAQLDATSGQLEKKTAANASCEQMNDKLYGIATDLLAKYRKVGFWDVFKRREPFTGVRRVEVENLLEDYRDKADRNHVTSPR
ncbi:MAG: hypothetical protein GC151_14185 [Betaproteobacteria bacterium]|nr:hypothetical protein [Betaproteobacteria bacterium]